MRIAASLSSSIATLSRFLRNRFASKHKVPYIQQLTATDCGAACLAMVLSALGRPTSLGELRPMCPTGRDGLGIGTLAKVARTFGLRVKAYAAEVNQISDVPLPAIAHWRFNHFIVLAAVSSRGIDIVDPASGRQRISLDDFGKDFTGIVLSIEAGPEFERRSINRDAKSSIRPLLKTVTSSSLFPQILLASFLIQLVGLVPPVAARFILDDVLALHQPALLNVILWSACLMLVSQGVISYLRGLALVSLRSRVDRKMTLRFVEHLFSLPFSFFQQRTTGDLLMRVGSNTVLRELVTTQALSLILDGAFLLGYLLLLFILFPVFGIAVLLLAGIQIGTVLMTYRTASALAQQDLAVSSEQQGYLIEAVSGICLIKASGSEHHAVDRWTNLFHKQLNVSVQRGRINALVSSVVGGLQSIGPVALLGVGAHAALGGRTSIGEVIALQSVAAGVLTPLASLIAAAQQMQVVHAHLERVADVMESEPEPSTEDRPLLKPVDGTIEFRNVSFRYTTESPWVVRNVSFKVVAGSTLAILGASGSGKSTLVLLLLGILKPDEGEILVDGIPLDTWGRGDLREQIGVVLQEPFLFRGSIRQNIAFGRAEINLQSIIQAATASSLHNEISRMPMEYETRISEGGSNLSGGQRQRLALARAILNDPRILVLDEATSHLDVHTEAAVAQNLSTLACTKILIAHRLSTVRQADQIIVVQGGMVVEQGRHETLQSVSGYYASLLKKDLAGVLEPQMCAVGAEMERSCVN
jgi:ABC-type bacteriocin/lantibiotic exporter with double-glycine peptidase domain